ncbi:MAG: hypothetical protein GTO63_00035 [Anaerolineae bacterium]|nr:hypothetical protein [Anaerolineae bacterium]NIN93393.1 hypothetical protein [Anaerolineae bacterium]NIQ76501.1 hypothetical protein [Anaerolineae bacterium]
MSNHRLSILLAATVSVSLVLLVGATGCASPCGILPPAAEPEIEVEFWASPDVVPPGGCTMLHWEVPGAEDYPVFLNGEEVPPMGEEEVCLEGPTTFELVVGAPGGPHEAVVYVGVEGELPPEEPPPGEPPPEEPPPQEPPPEEPPQEGGPEVIVFEVHPDAIPQGQCATLFWEVHPPGEWRVIMGGREVPPMGESEECPESTTTYELLVEAPGGPYVRTVTLHVEGAPGPEPTPPPPGPTATSPAAPPPTPATPTPTPWGAVATVLPVFSTDLAITDLYADKLLNGTVYGRFTNRGPGNLNNVVVQVSCQWSKTAYGDTMGVIEQMGPRQMTIISLSPNQTTPFSTNIKVDLTQFWYDMTCQVDVPFIDPNTANNSYNERLARP